MTAIGSQPTSRRRPSALAVVVCALAMLVAPIGPAASEPVCAHMTQVIKSFRVTAKTPKKVYRVGEIVPVTVTVTRPGEEDPAGEGIELPPVQGAPVEDAAVTVGLYGPVGFPVGGYGRTKADGKVVIRMKAASKLRRSFVLEARAEKRYFASGVGCVDPVEEGTFVQKNAFDVR